MILYLHGPDTFRSRQYLRDSVSKFKRERDPQGYNMGFLDGKTEKSGKILTEIASAPFLAERRMIVIDNILSSSDKELLGELIERTKNKKFPDSNVIIFWQGEALGKVKEVKELQALLLKEKYAQEFPLLTGAKLTAWASQEIKARGGQIESEALNFLCQNVAGDMWRLNSLIDQLVAYVVSSAVIPTEELARRAEESLDLSSRSGQEISRPFGNAQGRPRREASLEMTNNKRSRSICLADVQLFLDEKIDDNIFSMVDAIAQGNKKIAFKLLNEQRRLGEEDGKIFGLLVWQFRILLEMADLLERESPGRGDISPSSSPPTITSDTIAKKLGIHPFVAKKNIAVARRQSLAKWQDIYRRLLDIDIKTKTGLADQSLLIDVFVGRG